LLWLAALGYESDCNARVVAIQQNFFRTSFKNRFMKTVARFETARRERNAPRPATLIDQVMAVVRCRTFALTEELLRGRRQQRRGEAS
jgi:hypothetical protein